MQMYLESVIQREGSQKEKNKYHTLMHIYIYRIYKNGIEDLICKVEIETQIQRTNVWISKGEGGSYKELRDWD